MLKAIVFDFDGVLVDSEPLHYEAMLAVAKPLGVTFDYREYLNDLIGFDDRDAMRTILAKAGQTVSETEVDEPLRELMDEKQRAFEQRVAKGIEPIPGAMELLDAAAAAMPVAIASGATRADIELILGQLGRLDQFTTIVTADDVERSKPAPQSYVLAVQRLAETHPELLLSPRECLAIEDTAAGLASAHAAGLRTLGLTTTSPAESLRQADRVVPELAGITPTVLRHWFD
ncbi:HAD family hydrolase [Phycisphaerales bacterium AB-hyl4]|uniref:HAD family hydrolase n=1 Tax=Natronomicrosphaera hydrolytica TaxID=3242702 RepID=A0ABV4U031_9BACT